jgi:hypothetical protein
MSECEKRAYSNAHAARRANKAMGNSIRVYSCENCGQLHVTKERYGYSDWNDRNHPKRKKMNR